MNRTLIVHIGTGKTGSTAIQRFLGNHAERLRGMGVHHWGINLERVPGSPAFDWQHPLGGRILQRLKVRRAREQLETVLERAVRDLPEGSIATWSNESIHERPGLYVPALARLRDRHGLRIKPIAYVRNRRDYLRSAYAQWGVRDKGYAGRVLGFMDWVSSRTGFLSYGRRLAKWDEAFREELEVVNYDAVGDVVEHFLGLLPPGARGLPRPAGLRIHGSPSPWLLALYAVRNNLSDDAVGPDALDALTARHPGLREAPQPPLPPLGSLFPREAELDRAEEMLAEDRAIVDALLARHGQPPFAPTAGHAGPDTDRLAADLLSALLRTVIGQDRTIRELEERERDAWPYRASRAIRRFLSPPVATARTSAAPPAPRVRVAAPKTEDPPRLLGAIDGRNGTSIEGWVMLEHHPSVKFPVELVLDGKVIAAGVADRPRNDLRKAGLGNGDCSFRLAIPPGLSRESVDSIEVRIAGGLAWLRRSRPA
jgi:hypothetical protein